MPGLFIVRRACAFMKDFKRIFCHSYSMLEPFMVCHYWIFIVSDNRILVLFIVDKYVVLK